MQTQDLSIGEVARRAGVRPSALRYYERVGLLPPPERSNGRRRYDAHIVQRLAVIQLAQQAGLTIGEIGTLLHGFGASVPPGERWRSLAEPKRAKLDAVIARAQQMQRLLDRLGDCACLDLEACGTALALPACREAAHE